MQVINWILLIWLGIPVVYFFIFAVASSLKRGRPAQQADGRGSFAVLIPAYKSDSCILATAKAALDQHYPSDKFSVNVISDSMTPETDAALAALGVRVINVCFDNSTKAKSLQAAVEALGVSAADYVVILDADNIVRIDFLSRLNNEFAAGAKAIQAHRTAKNTDTSVAIIDAASEEINNSIFRSGHNALNISSALIGSGMAFSYDWFAQNINSFTTSGEDKEMELQLLIDGIFVRYCEDIVVFDEKTRTEGNYYNQHRRWIASQSNLLGCAARKFTRAKDKVGYADKLLQWCFPPRMIIIVMVPVLAVISLFMGGGRLWWDLVLMLLFAMMFALPQRFLGKEFWKAMLKVPVLAAMAFVNIFRRKGTKDTFIHTDHK